MALKQRHKGKRHAQLEDIYFYFLFLIRNEILLNIKGEDTKEQKRDKVSQIRMESYRMKT